MIIETCICVCVCCCWVSAVGVVDKAFLDGRRLLLLLLLLLLVLLLLLLLSCGEPNRKGNGIGEGVDMRLAASG